MRINDGNSILKFKINEKKAEKRKRISHTVNCNTVNLKFN